MLSPVKNKKEIVFLVLLACSSLFVLTVQIRKKEKISSFSDAIDILLYPVRTGVKYSTDFVKDIWDSYINLTTVHKENEELKAKVLEYENTINFLKEYEAENKRLKRMLKFKDNVKNEMIPARIVGKDSSSWFKTITLDKGIDDGAAKGFAVVTPMGIVGHIVETSRYNSRVILITDRNSGIAALIQKNRVQGIVVGGKGNECVLKFVYRSSVVEPRDLLVSSGLGGIFPKGLMVGRVTMVHEDKAKLFLEIYVKPAVDFSRLEEVLIIRDTRKN